MDKYTKSIAFIISAHYDIEGEAHLLQHNW